MYPGHFSQQLPSLHGGELTDQADNTHYLVCVGLVAEQCHTLLSGLVALLVKGGCHHDFVEI